MAQIEMPFNYGPREYQLGVWQAIDSGIKRVLLVWHRRAGKDKTSLNIMARASQERVGSYFFFLPTYAQGKKIIWDGMDSNGFRFMNHFPRDLWSGTPNSTEMKLKLRNGSIFQVVGSDNIDSIVGTNPVGCVFSEYALQDPRGWDFIRPILRENGGWAVFNGTPRGKNHMFRMKQMAEHNDDWFYQMCTVNDTNVLTEEDIQAERDAGMDEELIQQEFYCSFEGGLSGAYYGKEMDEAERDKRICEVPYDPMLPVDTWWDLGIGDATAIVFTQVAFNQIRVIDYYETSGEGLKYFIKYLAEKPYVYGDHIAPHDIEVREMGTGKSRLETARSLGLNFRVARKLPIDDGINAVRSMLPLCWFDRENTEHLREALSSYRKEFDAKNRCYKSKPNHDWSSHAADAMRTGAVGRRRAYVPKKKDRYQLKDFRHTQRTWMSA